MAMYVLLVHFPKAPTPSHISFLLAKGFFHLKLRSATKSHEMKTDITQHINSLHTILSLLLSPIQNL